MTIVCALGVAKCVLATWHSKFGRSETRRWRDRLRNASAGRPGVGKLGRRLVFIGLAVDLAGCGWVLALIDHSGTNVSLWALAPALFVIGIGTGLCFATIPTVALGDAKPDEAGSASGSLSSIQQLASAIGSAAVTSIFFQAATSGLAHAMKVTLIVVLAVTALSLPIVALMPRKAPSEPHQ